MTAIAGKGDVFENDLLKHIFQNAALPLIGDASGLQPSATTGSLYLSLHTADPTEEGDQTTNEIAYTSYARVAVARTSGGWTVTGSSVALAALVSFPKCTGGSATATFVVVGTAPSGAGKILYGGALATSIAVANGVTPQLTTGTTVTEA